MTNPNAYATLPPEGKLLRAIFGEPVDGKPPLNEIDGISLRNAILSLLSSDPLFAEREVKVLRMRFGFDDPLGKAQTLDQVKVPFGVTRERIRQIEGKALRKLRHPSRARYLKPYLGISPSIADWRPQYWHRKLPRIGNRAGDFRIETLRESAIARCWFERGANGIIEALLAEGKLKVKVDKGNE